MPFLLIQISNTYCQKSYYGFWGFLVISSTSEIFLIYTFLTVERRPFSFFVEFAQIYILFLYWKKHCNLFFDDTLKIYCWALCYLDSNFKKQALLKLRVVEYSISLFLISHLCLFQWIFCQRNLWNNYHFLIKIIKIQ